ncbi:unnamed protein product [marine sediment metagenome]|uniref:Uncharacterized protein n=1 Tax=marine sediment metagenome TaxID=412755 RepID=X1UEI4_9ZZZZ
MYKQILSKFSVYDQVGYLMVGSISLIVLYLDSLFLGVRFPRFDLNSSIIWFIVTYFLGHIIQAIANIIIKEKKEDFNEKEKKILEIAKEFFDIKNLSESEIWSLCYMMAFAKDITGQISTFNAYYSLYRGWFVIFALESLFLLLLNIFRWFNFAYLILFLISNFLTILFFRRKKRFYGYLKIKVLQTFILLRKVKS